MKKKAIEKIPYLTLPKTIRRKGAKYIGVTAVRNVGDEEHFFLEVYRNNEVSKMVPEVRIVCTKKDFGTFFTNSGEWSRRKLKDSNYSTRLIWEDATDKCNEKEKRNILYDALDMERVKNFFSDQGVWSEQKWWEYINRYEDMIVCRERDERADRKRRKRIAGLKEREENTAELPEVEILKMADERYFSNKHYLYYKKHGCFARIACTKCGGVTDARWKNGISYESQFERWTDEPREHQFGKCPLCGERGEWKCQGKAQKSFEKSVYVFLGQKYKETGFVMRYIEVSKEWQLGLICREKGLEMYNAYEKMSGIEIARAYFEEGKAMQIDFHKHNTYTGKDFWDDCNLYGIYSISIKSAPVMWQTYKEMKGTILQYSALKEYMAAARKVNAIDYLNTYIKIPQIEMLVKMNLTGIVEGIVRGNDRFVIDKYAKRPDKFLGIRKERIKKLIEKKGNTELLEVMQMEKRMGQNWTEEQIEQLAEINVRRGAVEVMLRFMSIQQFLNRVKKYAGCEYGTGCTSAIEKLRQTAQTYMDYLNMRAALGYDLHNTVYQRPRSLTAAHEKMVMESNKKEIDKRLNEVAVRFPMIRKNYRKLRSRFYYEDDNFLIRPARSAEEIVMEGRMLHHCVGGDNYLKKHNDGETYILLLRVKEDPEIPYITVEIGEDTLKIMQWYGAYDRKPDESRMKDWLDNYIKKLKNGGLAAGMKEGQQEEQQLLQAAM